LVGETGFPPREGAEGERRSLVLDQLDLVRLDQRGREELLAHACEVGARLLAVAVLELEVDDATDPCIVYREAELLERAEHSLALGVEGARLRADEHGRSHPRTTSGSSR